ncbi:MAG: hypothetical protein ACT4NY_20760 [Pseudonocardiales bacterium]
MHEGKVVPSVIVLSHEEQLDRLRIGCPEAVEAAVVAGDPCFDRMLASLPLRESYRQAFGLAPHQRLIVVSSTWGAASLYGSDPQLIGRLAARLPVDSHRLAVALHPNIVYGHSRWQVKTWLDECVRDGVLVLPEEDLWRPALVAADLVIGDHGSVSFYAAALGRPILLAAVPADAVDPRSPIGHLLRAAPRLDRGEDPLAHIEWAIVEHDPTRYTPITSLTTSHPGEAATLLRRVLYGLLDLPPPSAPPVVTALPLPESRLAPPRALLVTAELTAGAPGQLEATVSRYAAGSVTGPALIPSAAHLVVDVDAPTTTMLDLAEIVVHRSPDQASRWITETLRALPGCLLAMAGEKDDYWLIGGADGSLIRLNTPPNAPPPNAPPDAPSVEAPVFASVVHAWLCTGRPVTDLPSRLLARIAGAAGCATAVLVAPPLTRVRPADTRPPRLAP